MFLVSYLKSFLNYFNFFKRQSNIVLLGLDNAGKTTLLRRLKDDRMIIHDPTIYAHSEQIQLGNTQFKIVDVGGHKSMRKIWKNYYLNVDAIIFIVDSTDHKRLMEAKIELRNVIDNITSNLPILLLGNKIDVKEAVGECEFLDKLDIKNEKNQGRLGVFMCSVAKRIGYKEGFEWLNDILSNNK